MIYSDAYGVLKLPKTILDGHSGNGSEGIFNHDMTEIMSNLVMYAVPKANQPTKTAPTATQAERIALSAGR